jgi:hypothetical protein
VISESRLGPTPFQVAILVQDLDAARDELAPPLG